MNDMHHDWMWHLHIAPPPPPCHFQSWYLLIAELLGGSYEWQIMTDPGSLHVMSQIHSSMRSSFANRSIITQSCTEYSISGYERMHMYIQIERGIQGISYLCNGNTRLIFLNRKYEVLWLTYMYYITSMSSDSTVPFSQLCFGTQFWTNIFYLPTKKACRLWAKLPNEGIAGV